VPWSIYAFDPTERPKVGHRSREWTATAMIEAAVVRDMARAACARSVREERQFRRSETRARKRSHRPSESRLVVNREGQFDRFLMFP
jgi:hypothetical protein